MRFKKNVAMMAFVMSFVGYGVCNSQINNLQESDLFNANVEALASGDNNPNDEEEGGDNGGGLVVKCFCKKTTIEDYFVCSAMGTFAYCGGDPCPSHDPNCR